MPIAPRPTRPAAPPARRPPGSPGRGRRGACLPRAGTSARAPAAEPASAPTGCGSFGSGDSQRLLDLRDDPGFGFEELLVDLAPAAECFDREEARRRREAAGTGDARHHRPVALLRPDLLPGGGQQVVD